MVGLTPKKKHSFVSLSLIDKGMGKCGCCEAEGKNRTGCSCQGGKSHVCLKTPTSTMSSLAPYGDEKAEKPKKDKPYKTMWKSFFPGIHVDSDLENDGPPSPPSSLAQDLSHFMRCELVQKFTKHMFFINVLACSGNGYILPGLKMLYFHYSFL
jgi:hypothetical protein